MAFDLRKLGVKRNVPKVSFFEYSGLIIAPSKWGKTTIASMIPKSITCAFEIGYRGQVMNYKDMETWDDFIDFIDMLEDNRKEIGDEIEIIAIDTVNIAYDKCKDYTLKRLGRIAGKSYKRPQDVPHGQFYPERDKDFAEQLNRLNMLGFKPFFLTHSKIKTIQPKDETAQPYDVYTSTMEERCSNIVLPMVDYIIYGERRFVLNENGDKVATRAITTKGDPNLTAGNRVYMKEDIVFENELEAITKFQENFGKVIEERLRNAGILEDIKDIEKKQKDEKTQKIDEFIKDKADKEDTEEVKQEKLDKIKSNLSKLDMAKLQEIMKKHSVTNFNDAASVPTKALDEILALI